MDKYYGNVCELDIIFNFQKAYFILDELLLAGEMQESSKKNVLRCISQQDSLEDMEVSRLQFYPHHVPLMRYSSVSLCGCPPLYYIVFNPIPCHTPPPSQVRANALPRLRKTWSPRSCNDGATHVLFFFGVASSVYILIIPTCHSGRARDLSQLGRSRAMKNE